MAEMVYRAFLCAKADGGMDPPSLTRLLKSKQVFADAYLLEVQINV